MTPIQMYHARRHPGRVLVVDDYAEIRAVVAKLLTGAGYTVTCAASSEAALRRIAAGPDAVALLLTDLDISPDMWGDELAGRVRAHMPTLPAMVMSGQLGAVAHASLARYAGGGVTPEALLARPAAHGREGDPGAESHAGPVWGRGHLEMIRLGVPGGDIDGRSGTQGATRW